MAKKQTGPIRYAIYSRCSSDDQAHKDFSTVDVQEGLNRQYVQDKGGVFVTAYRDEGITGTTLKRPNFQKLLADAKAGGFDVVICTYMSRLGRGETFTVAEYLLKEAGVKVEMVKEQFTDDVSGYVGKQMTQFVDGMYVEQVRQWTRTKMEAMVKAGYFPGGYPPFGMRKVTAMEATGFHRAGSDPPKRLEPDPAFASIVQQAFGLFLETGQQAKVREYLNAVTPRSWTTTAVKRLLTNEVYKGDIVFGQWRNEGAYEAIVDPATWNAVQEVFGTQPSRGARPDTDDGYVYYLRGRVRCPYCGCPCTQAGFHGKTKKVHYYVCQRANRRDKNLPPCPIGRMNADRVHATVLHHMQYASEHPTVMHRLIAQSGGWGNADEAQKALRGQLGRQKQAVEMRIANYVKAIGEGRMSEALLSALDKAEAEKETLCQQMKEVDQEIVAATIKRPTAAQVQASWGQVSKVWEVLTEEEKADLLCSFVQVVEMTEKENVTLELLPVSLLPSLGYSPGFELNSQMGAGRLVVVNYPPILFSDFEVTRTTRSRTT